MHTHLDQAKQDVCVQRALVRLVDHHHAVAGEVGLAQELTQQHAVRHVPAVRRQYSSSTGWETVQDGRQYGM